MGPQGRTAEQKLARVASTSHGVVTHAQLVSAGLTAKEIRRRVEKGALLREYRGVYRVGHRAPSLEARYLAAVYACGPGALLSGRAAAHLLEILATPPSMPEVTTPTERKQPGVKTHRNRSIHPLDAQFWRGVPITSVARTIVDLAATLDSEQLARVVHEAGIRHNTAPNEIELRSSSGRPSYAGAPGSCAACSRGDEPDRLSAIEPAGLREGRYPCAPVGRSPTAGRRPIRRLPLGGAAVDRRAHGYRYHSSRHAGSPTAAESAGLRPRRRLPPVRLRRRLREASADAECKPFLLTSPDEAAVFGLLARQNARANRTSPAPTTRGDGRASASTAARSAPRQTHAAFSSSRVAGSAPSMRSARSSTWRTWCGLTPSARAVSLGVCGASRPRP